MAEKMRLGGKFRVKTLQIRVSESELATIQAEAKRRGMSVADMIRDALNHYWNAGAGAKSKSK